MQPNPQESAAYAAMFTTMAADVRAGLERHQREVKGDPARLAALADQYRARADQTQDTVWAVRAQQQVLANNWSGSASTRTQQTARRVTAGLGTVVRRLRDEQAWLTRCSAELTKAHGAIGATIESFNAGATRIIEAARAGAVYAALRSAWQILVRNTWQQAMRARNDLAAVLASAKVPGTETWWRRNVGSRLEQALRSRTTRPPSAPGSGSIPHQSLDPQETEFSESMSMLVWRMNHDATSDTVRQLSESWYHERFGPWARLTGPNGQYDLKPYFDQKWQLLERNNVFIAMPPELGTVGGRPVEIDRDLLGNIHYGYVAAAVGAQDWVSGWGGTAALGADVIDKVFHGEGDAGDRLAISLGRDLYARLPPPAELTPQHVGALNRAVVDALRTNFDALVAAGKIRAR